MTNKDSKYNAHNSLPNGEGKGSAFRLKVCGMKYEDNIKAVAALNPDYLGFIFYEKSLRNFKLNSIPEIPNHIKKTGVFVDSDLDFAIKKVTQFGFKAIQLHGEESPEFCLALKRHYNKKNDEVISPKETVGHDSFQKSQNDNKVEIIKVFSINDNFNFDVLKPYETIVDYFLFDTQGKLPGGNGFTFNWSVLNKYPSTTPFFLSGGIGLEQVENLKQFLNSEASKYCEVIDVNSQFEIEPGLKKIEDLVKFIQNVITKRETTK